MFKLYYIEEIFHSLKQHKLRNVLTGFGVAWGVFILVLLLSAGDGLQKGVMKLFGGFAQNSLWIYGGQSSTIEIGMTAGKSIIFTEKETELLEQRYQEIEAISPEVSLTNSIVSFEENYGVYSIKGIGEDYFRIKILGVEQGRCFNYYDNIEKRNVVVIGSRVKDIVFKESEAVGQFVNIAGAWFKVVGVLNEGTLFNQNQQDAVYIPFNTMKSVFNQGNEFTVFGLTLKQGTRTKGFEKKIKKYLANRIKFDESDKKALFIMNFDEQIKTFDKLFKGLKVFLGFIGVCLLLSGIIGIGNIMLIVVRERTREIGIRKAVGAKSKAIIMMILSESVAITFIAGLVGLLLGVGVTSLVNLVMSRVYANEDVLISSFNINFSVAITAMFLIIISGCIAGLYPARKAAEIMPVVALNYEQD